MGYRAHRTTYKLVFEEDSKLHGLEILAKALTFGEVNEFTEKWYSSELRGPARIQAELEDFLPYVESWNLEDGEGNTLPISVEILLLQLELVDCKDIIAGWWGSCLGVSIPAPLSRPSSSGDSSVEESTLPMEPL